MPTTELAQVKLPDPHQPKFRIWLVGGENTVTECGKILVEWASNSQLNCEWVTLMDEKALNFHRPRAPEVGLLMALPETSTWSRARQRDSGPQPLRTATWPWGLPGLSGASDNSVRRENESLKVALKAFQAIDAGRGVALLSFPEQSENGPTSSICAGTHATNVSWRRVPARGPQAYSQTFH